MGKKDKSAPSSILENRGILAGIIIIAVIISLAVGIFIGNTFATGTTGGITVVSPNECGATVISYANANLIPASNASTLVSVTDKNGMYQINSRNALRTYGFFATKDCNLLFINPYTLKGNATPMVIVSPKSTSSPTSVSSPKPTTSPTPIPEPVKSSRPSVELFVMSFCPFGVQAENAMEPVVGLLGTKSDIKVHYIATVSGTTLDSVKSLHGPTEAKEDVRQLCIAKDYPQKLWPYLMDFDKNCQNSTLRKDLTALDACSANSARVADIDNQKIETCVSSGEGMALLSADVAIAQNNKVTGSPTIFINGQKYVGQRTADAYKQGICDRFDTPPAECSVNLSAQAAAASSGSC
jgi:glutaredoxin